MNNPVIIIDNGSNYIKSGYCTNDNPLFTLKSCIALTENYPSWKLKTVELENIKRNYIGDETDDIKYKNIINYPIKDGIITDWIEIEKLYDYIFDKQLNINPSENSFIFSESPLNPRKNREKILELLYETYNVQSMQLLNQNILSLYASGRLSGLSFTSGYTSSYSVPIYEGNALVDNIIQVKIGGKHITESLQQLLSKSYPDLSLNDIIDIKEKLCYIANDYEYELESLTNSATTEQLYSNPNPPAINIHSERIQSTEVLLNPSLCGYNDNKYMGFHKMIHNSIISCNSDIQHELYRNIILSGGNTMITGLSERLETEITKLTNYKCKIISPPERKYSSWIGASILGKLDSFYDMAISKEDYNEFGSSIIHTKSPLGINSNAKSARK